MVNKNKDKNNKNNTSYSLVFGRWPQTKIIILGLKFWLVIQDVEEIHH